jgi:outer membrane scaffolding protein for murein synthesis (MipA/OmpV family)
MNGVAKVLATITFGIIVLVSTAVGAYETGEREWTLGKQLSLGNGIMEKMKQSTGGDADSFNAPLLFHQGDRFFIENTTLKYQLIEWENFAVGTIGKYRFEVFDESERDLLNGLEERDAVLDVGLNIDFTTEFGVVGIDLLTDALGAENGQKVDISWKKAFNASRWSIEPFVKFSWNGNKLADYYYGAETSQEQPLRPGYSAQSALNWQTGLDIHYRLSEHLKLMGGVGFFELLDHEIEDSLVTDDETQTLGVLGVLYLF